MWFYESLLSAVLFAGAGLFFKASSSNSLNSATFFFYLYFIGALVLTIYLYLESKFQISIPIVISGLVIGGSLALGNSLLISALDKGPISLTSPIINLNIVFLVLAAVIVYGESITRIQIFLVGLLILSVLMLSIDPHEELRIKKRSWYVLVILASVFLAVRNGGLKVTNEIGLDNNIVLFYSYAIPALVFYFMKPRNYLAERQAIFLGGLGGMFSILGMVLYAHALSAGPASIVIPVFCTYNIFLIIGGYFLFKERLSKVQKLSVCLAVLSSAFLRMV